MSAAPVTARVAAEVAQLADEDLIAMLDRAHAIEESLHETQRRLAGVVNVPVRYLGELGDALLVERVAVARAQAVARAYLNAIDGELLTRPLRDEAEYDEAEHDRRATRTSGADERTVEDVYAVLDHALSTVRGFLEELAARGAYPRAAATDVVVALTRVVAELLRWPGPNCLLQMLRDRAFHSKDPASMLVRDYLGAVFCWPPVVAVVSTGETAKFTLERARHAALFVVSALGRVRMAVPLAPDPGVPLAGDLPDEVRQGAAAGDVGPSGGGAR